MHQFEQLRRQAIAHREDKIEAAREECRQSMVRIRQLERAFGVKRPRPEKPQPMSALLCRCLPRDRLFTIPELLSLMEMAEPDRIIKPNSARTQFHILEKQGGVRRVMRDGDRHILWAVRNYKTPEVPFAAMNMRQVAEELLREKGPLTVAEIIVTLQVRGYRPGANPRMLHETCRTCLCKRPDLFKRNGRGGRWSLAK
jgi:hypothetical protein